jgi:dihydrofolate reductase
MQLALIVATDQNNGIGRNGNQPFFISNDLKRFKALTTGQTIVMGRKTFEALPKGALPKRRNLVLTHNCGFSAPGTEVLHRVEALEEMVDEDEKVFVIGGGELYKLFLPRAEIVYLTRVHQAFEGIDTWFPRLIGEEWTEVEQEGPFKDDKSGLAYSFLTFKRVKPSK